MTITVTIGLDPATQAQIDRIEASIAQLQKGDVTIMADLTALTAEVARDTTVEESAVTLIQGLAAQIAAAGTDPVKLAALQAQLKTSTDALAAAVAANTSTTPPPATPPAA